MEAVLPVHDRSRFEVFCYSDAQRADEVTSRLRQVSDFWRDATGLSDGALAEQVRRDRIDILVDLAGHMARNRLLAFARKPAPVQVSLFGYPATTGLTAIDCRITDSLADPIGETEAFHVERLVRLRDCAWCYHPAEDSPAVGPLPAGQNGFVTFGCLNNPIKLAPPALALWSRALRAVPQSRLMLLSSGGANENAYLLAHFRDGGIASDRIDFVRRRPRRSFLELLTRIDIAFDPFPYNGGVTTCDSLWMGVPVLTLAGNSYASRQGIAVLSNAGLDEFIAPSEDAFVMKAVGFTWDLKHLAEVRNGLRADCARAR